jgi:hypothetical protein
MSESDSGSNTGSSSSSSSTVNETEGLKYTLLLAVIIFIVLLTCFESIRGIKNIFLKRINRKFLVRDLSSLESLCSLFFFTYLEK